MSEAPTFGLLSGKVQFIINRKILFAALENYFNASVLQEDAMVRITGFQARALTISPSDDDEFCLEAEGV